MKNSFCVFAMKVPTKMKSTLVYNEQHKLVFFAVKIRITKDYSFIESDFLQNIEIITSTDNLSPLNCDGLFKSNF